MRLFAFRALVCLLLFIPVLKAQAPAARAPGTPMEAGTYAVLDTSLGVITCRLLPKEAPNTVKNFEGLVTGAKAWTDPKTGKERHTPFYTGLTFHRIIKSFMIQAGDPLANGEGGPGFSIDDEPTPNRPFDKPGLLAMAKRSFPNSAGSQFFLTTGPADWLTGKYTVFGEVVSGQEVIDRIAAVATDEDDKPKTPVTIRTIRIKRVPAASTSTARP